MWFSRSQSSSIMILSYHDLNVWLLHVFWKYCFIIIRSNAIYKMNFCIRKVLSFNYFHHLFIFKHVLFPFFHPPRFFYFYYGFFTFLRLFLTLFLTWFFYMVISCLASIRVSLNAIVKPTVYIQGSQFL